MRNKIFANLSVLVLALFLCLVGCSNHSAKVKEPNSDLSAETDIADDVVNLDNIDEKIAEFVNPFSDEDGYIERDKEKLTEVSGGVYEYALNLKKNGDILDCTYCEESWTVAFYFDEETVWLYMPHIRQTYSGNDADEFTVTSVESIKWLDDTVITGVDQFSKFRITGARESAELIYNTFDEYSSYEDIGRNIWKSMDDVVAWMQSLAKNNTRAILWRGHGSVYKTRTDKLAAVWILPIERNEANEKYKDTEDSLLFSGKNCAISANFWKKYCALIDGGIFISGSCSTGADGGTTAAILFDKGFSAYVAPNADIWTTYSDKIVGRIVEYMCGNVDDVPYNINDALEKAKKDVGEKDIYGTRMVCTNADPNDPFMLVPTNCYELYAELLHEKANGYFALIYIDDDKIPELAYFPESEPGICKPIELYTVYKGELMFLIEKYVYGGSLIYSEKNNRIFTFTGVASGFQHAEYTYMIQDGVIVDATDYEGYTVTYVDAQDGYENNEEDIQLMLNGLLDRK